MPVSATEGSPPSLRAAMRQLAGGVSLVTVGDGESRRGFTATSVTSLTLDPPCILVCVNRKVSALATILERRRFGVSVLSEAQRPLAVRFSGTTGVSGAARFAEGRWSQTGPDTPLLDEGLAAVACDLEETIERHSHLILIGAVTAVRVGESGAPLIYAQGGYGRLAAEA